MFDFVRSKKKPIIFCTIQIYDLDEELNLPAKSECDQIYLEEGLS